MPSLEAVRQESAEIRPLRGAWTIVALLWVVGCLNYLDRMMIATMRDSLKEAIPMGDDQFGLLTTAFLGVYGLLSPVGGWLADRFGRSRVIVASLATWSLVTWLTSYAQTFHQLLATRAIMGISEACYIPAALALIADYHRGSTRSLATGLHMSGLYAGMALGGMGGWMAERFGWSSSFFTFGCFGVAYSIVLASLLRDVPRADCGSVDRAPAHPAGGMRALAGNAAFWTLAAHWSLLSFATWGFVTWMPTFLRERYDLTQTDAGILSTTYMQAAAFAGVLVGGAMADHWSRTFLRGRIWVPMIAITLASPFVFMAGHTEQLWFAVACLIAFGFARGCSDANMMPILCQVADPRHRATGYGMLNFCTCSVGGLSAYLGGWLKEGHIELSYLFMGSGIGVFGSGLLLYLVKPSRRG